MDRHASARKARKTRPITTGLALALAAIVLASCAAYPDNSVSSSRIATRTYYAPYVGPGIDSGRIRVDGSFYYGGPGYYSGPGYFGGLGYYGGLGAPYPAPYFGPGFHPPFAGLPYPLFVPFTPHDVIVYGPYAGYPNFGDPFFGGPYFGDPYFALYGFQSFALYDRYFAGYGFSPFVHARVHARHGQRKDRKRDHKRRHDKPAMASDSPRDNTAPVNVRRLRAASKTARPGEASADTAASRHSQRQAARRAAKLQRKALRERAAPSRVKTERQRTPTWTAATPGHAAPRVLMPASMGTVAVPRPTAGGSGAGGGPSSGVTPRRPAAAAAPVVRPAPVAMPSPARAAPAATATPRQSAVPSRAAPAFAPAQKVGRAAPPSAFRFSPRHQGATAPRRHRR